MTLPFIPVYMLMVLMEYIDRPITEKKLNNENQLNKLTMLNIKIDFNTIALTALKCDTTEVN